jgi:membrane protein
MYQVRESRNTFSLYIYSCLYSVVFAVLLLLLLGVMVFGKWLSGFFLKRIPLIGTVFTTIINLRSIICLAVLFLFFLLLYYFIPNRKQTWKAQIPGAAFSSLGWMVFSYVFSIYVDNFTNYGSFYGAMTTIALLMLWVYGCMYMLFLGGLWNSARIERFVGHKRKKQEYAE